MRTIGIVGGMSWESSAEYYRLINEGVKVRLVPAHSAELVMISLDFHPIAQLELTERWEELAVILGAAITAFCPEHDALISQPAPTPVPVQRGGNN